MSHPDQRPPDHRPDHRELNRDLALVATDPLAGAGLPLWLPAGAAVRGELERLARDLARADGCEEVHTPVLGKRALFERSGHWAKFSDDMFPPMRLGDEAPGDELVLRPANCPHHALVYASRRRSWRELPVRLHEMAPMFRAERSGVLSGLGRVRQITLDDTHVFCRPDQVADEAERGLRSALRAQELLGIEVHHVRLSRRGPQRAYLGSDGQWEEAEAALRVAASAVLAGPPVDGPDEAAFYGPKLDLQVLDARGHEETIATVQLDFVQPERFDLTFDDAASGRSRVVMIHRGTVGAMERVVASVVERHDGRLPLWLAPGQLCVLPVGTVADGAARSLHDAALAAGLRSALVVDGSLGSRVRAARVRREAVVAVVGEREAAAGVARVSDVAAGVDAEVAVDELVAVLAEAARERLAIPRWPAAGRSAPTGAGSVGEDPARLS